MKCVLQVGEVHQPAALGLDRAGDVQCDAERVAVESAALVALGDVRKAMRCLERELLEDLGGRDAGPAAASVSRLVARAVVTTSTAISEVPTSLWVCRLSFHCGCARQYSIASCVLRSRSGPSIGCR